MGFEPTPRTTVKNATVPTSRSAALMGAWRSNAIHRFQFTLRGLVLAIGFFAIDFSVVALLCRATEPCRLVNLGVALVGSGYLFAAFLTIAGTESAGSEC